MICDWKAVSPKTVRMYGIKAGLSRKHAILAGLHCIAMFILDALKTELEHHEHDRKISLTTKLSPMVPKDKFVRRTSHPKLPHDILIAKRVTLPEVQKYR